MREGLEHCALTPVQHRSLRGQQWIPAVVEVSFPIPHIIDRPRSHFGAQVETLWVSRRKECKCVNRLGRTLDIYGVCACVVILRAAVCFKKVRRVETKTSLKMRAILLVARVLKVCA